MSQIMKKAILTFGLFSMMLVLTSFTSNEIGGVTGTTTPRPTLPLYEIGGTGTVTPRPTLPLYEIGGTGTVTPRPTLPFFEIGGTGTVTPKPTLP